MAIQTPMHDNVLHEPPPALMTAIYEFRRRGLRGVRRRLRSYWMHRLRQRNLDASRTILAPGGPVVSLTTYEPRWTQVFYAIESIADGKLKPSRLMLWVAASTYALGIPPELKRLVARGLEIHICEDLGPHKKYFPAVMQATSSVGLVTADDDTLYPRDWLETLVTAAIARPTFIHGHRARVMSFDADGGFNPYKKWAVCRSTVPSALHFTTGVGGVLYPPAMQEVLRAAGDGFRSVCPRADDIWLNANAFRAGIKVCQVAIFPPLLSELPGASQHGLARENVHVDGNNHQLGVTYSQEERGRLCALFMEEYGGVV